MSDTFGDTFSHRRAPLIVNILLFIFHKEQIHYKSITQSR